MGDEIGERRHEEETQIELGAPYSDEPVPVGGTLTVLTGSEAGRFLFVTPAGGILGRGEGADYVFHEPGISREHACIELHGNAFVIEDLGSANGTYVDSVRVIEPVTLPSSCRIRLGLRSIFQFQEVDELGATAMEKLSSTQRIDPLTGAGNRDDLRQRLHQEVSFARRHEEPLGVLMLDIDGFTRVNDTRGATLWDQLLAEVGGILLETIRAEDAVYRCGGDEFCILARGIPDAGMRVMAERIRDQVAAFALPTTDGEPISVTLCVGIATNGGDRARVELLHDAHQALRSAQGRGAGTIAMMSGGSPVGR